MKNLKIINQEKLKDWAEEIFQKNSFNMIDVKIGRAHVRTPVTRGSRMPSSA